MSWKRDPKTWAAIAVTLLLWASAFAGIRAGMRLTPDRRSRPRRVRPGRGGPPAFRHRIRWCSRSMRCSPGCGSPTRATWGASPIAGLTGITIYHVALNFGEMTVESGAASLLIAAGPVFTALMSAAFLGERLTVLGWLGIAVAFVGVASSRSARAAGLQLRPGALLILLAAVSTSVFFIISQEAAQALLGAGVHQLLDLGRDHPAAVLRPRPRRAVPQAAPSATLAIIYLGIFPAAIAYVLWNYALARMPASILSSFLYLAPVLAMAIAWVWLGELPTVLTIVGGAVAIVGVVVVQTKGQARRVARLPPRTPSRPLRSSRVRR